LRQIGLLYNVHKQEACSVRTDICRQLERTGIRVVDVPIDHDTAIVETHPELKSCELVIVLGGDGTLLGVARQLSPFHVPMFGVNIGHLGFLTESEPSQLEIALERIVAGEYNLETRLMLEAFVYRDLQEIARFTALNDVGVGKGSFARMVTLDVHVDDVYVDTYTGDGMIVATPTGSTAYSLSCGGPIVSPHLQVMVLTPVCPHTLFSRPCVIDASSWVRLSVHARHGDVELAVDGQEGMRLLAGDEVLVRKAPFQATLVRLPDREFFGVLRSKLHGDPSST